LQAANALVRANVLGTARNRKQHPVIPIREDEPQVKVGRQVNSLLQDSLLAPLGLDSPWVR
jgi:hypothetical protein